MYCFVGYTMSASTWRGREKLPKLIANPCNGVGNLILFLYYYNNNLVVIIIITVIIASFWLCNTWSYLHHKFTCFALQPKIILQQLIQIYEKIYILFIRKYNNENTLAICI